MGVAQPPHRPTPGELEATRRMNLPQSDGYVDSMLALAAKALAERRAEHAIDVLKGLVMIRPDDPRVYEAFGQGYQLLGQQAAAQLCLAEAAKLPRR